VMNWAQQLAVPKGADLVLVFSLELSWVRQLVVLKETVWVTEFALGEQTELSSTVVNWAQQLAVLKAVD